MEITVNTDTGIVLMRASAGLSDTDATVRIGTEGITMEDFFTSNVTYAETTVISGDLTSATLSPIPPGSKTYDRLGTFNYDANDGQFAAGNDLNLYKNGGDNPNQVFTTSTQALTGESTVDFSATVAALPGLGATGNIISGYQKSGTPDHGEVIGQWLVVDVVPEPSSTILLGMAGLAFFHRRRR